MVIAGRPVNSVSGFWWYKPILVYNLKTKKMSNIKFKRLEKEITLREKMIKQSTQKGLQLFHRRKLNELINELTK